MNENVLAEEPLSAGKKAEFEMFVKKNMKRAYFTALGLVGSHDAAMDMSQEAFIRSYKSFEKFDNKKNFFTWYYRILKNLCLNFIRDNKRNVKERFLEMRDESLTVNSPAEDSEKTDLLEKLQESLENLSDEEREIIMLKEFEEYSYKDISELLNLPVGTVMSRLFYARKKLSGILKGKI